MPDLTEDILLARVPWADLDELVRHQQRNREVHSPGISLFRWWARRSHGLIGALLDAATVDGDEPYVSDPFSGGGTVAMEAARRGLGVYAQDLHPWATSGLASTLDGVDPAALAGAGAGWLKRLQEARADLYGTQCPAHGAAEVLHTFWVRQKPCRTCAEPIYLFPYSMVTLDSRAKDEPLAWFGCRACGHLTRSRRELDRRACGGCGRRLEPCEEPLLADGRASCPHHRCAEFNDVFASAPNWVPCLVQRLCRDADGRPHAHFARPSPSEASQAVVQGATPPMQLLAEIPSGVETRRLRRAHHRRWADLYPPRQLETMLLANKALTEMKLQSDVRARLRLVLCGAGEMAGFASRWDRYYPKAFEATANHRFNLTGFACESNLLSERGRGTLPRRLEHSVRAARWAEPFRTRASRSRSNKGILGRDPHDAAEARVVRGSSTRQLLPAGAVDLVLTDPPYFDDVQYAELAALFLAWAQATGLTARNVHVDLRSEAVANTARSTGVAEYRRLLTRILRETRRTMRPDGRMVLTFHNTDGHAWWALGSALAGAGFGVTALAVAHAENETDHAKRNRRTFTRDLILECRVAPVAGPPVVATPTVAGEAAELLAAGKVVAELCVGDDKRLKRNYDAFAERLAEHLGDEHAVLIRLPKKRTHKAA
jgi:16S rRNA G966 N2-methylase RsmD